MKYIIDVPEDRVVNKKLSLLTEVESPLLTRIQTGIICEPYTEPDREAIEDEVWEFVRIVTDMTEAQRIQCFGGATCDLDDYWTYRDAKAKYEAWKKKKEEIRVGDEVEQITASGNPVGLKCVVTKIVDDEILKGITQTGEVVTCSSQIKRWWRKTGHHFDEVEELLKKMRGDAE